MEAEKKMSSGCFGIYDRWEEKPLACKDCGWSGMGKDCHIDTDGVTFTTWVDCPQCRKNLAILPPKTPEAILEAAQEGIEAAKDDLPWAQAVLAEREAYAREKEALAGSQLASPAQLPDIEESFLCFNLDHASEAGRDFLVVRLFSRTIWKEPCLRGDLERKDKIHAILREKYKDRIARFDTFGTDGFLEAGWVRTSTKLRWRDTEIDTLALDDTYSRVCGVSNAREKVTGS